MVAHANGLSVVSSLHVVEPIIISACSVVRSKKSSVTDQIMHDSTYNKTGRRSKVKEQS